jgi:hypothetical protein
VQRRRPFVIAILLIAVACVVVTRPDGDSAAAPVTRPWPAPGQAAPASPADRSLPVSPPVPALDRAVPASMAVAGAAARATAARATAARRQAATRVAERRRHNADRQAEARRLRRSRTVAGALRRAWLVRAISRREYEQLRGSWWRAQRDAGRLTGTRRAELRAVLTMASRLAAARILTAGRIEPVFLTVRRNREFWTSRPLPRPGARVTFAGDPVVFEYYAGRGLAIQPLASFGKANALAGSCLRLVTRYRCRPAALRRLLDRMLALGSPRGGFLAWEYLVAFGSGAPPWISAMTQATAAQALARGRRALGASGTGYSRAARRALGAFDRPPPVGIAVASGRGRRYTMYSFAPRLRIYNGELQALIGLRDVARILASHRAQRLYARGEPAARHAVRAFDTGAWSLYSEGGAESTLGYHRLLATFLQGMCTRTGTRTYCAAGRRFTRYVREPPRVRATVAPWLRAHRRTAVTFTLSKAAYVVVHVRDRGGRVEHARARRLTRGRHRFVWVPSRAGRHRLRIVATGPAGTRAVVRRTLTARAMPGRRAKAVRARAETAAAAKRTKAAARRRSAAGRRQHSAR